MYSALLNIIVTALMTKIDSLGDHPDALGWIRQGVALVLVFGHAQFESYLVTKLAAMIEKSEGSPMHFALVELGIKLLEKHGGEAGKIATEAQWIVDADLAAHQVPPGIPGAATAAKQSALAFFSGPAFDPVPQVTPERAFSHSGMPASGDMSGIHDFSPATPPVDPNAAEPGGDLLSNDPTTQWDDRTETVVPVEIPGDNPAPATPSVEPEINPDASDHTVTEPDTVVSKPTNDELPITDTALDPSPNDPNAAEPGGDTTLPPAE